MRKASIFLSGALVGAGLLAVVETAKMTGAVAASSDTYRRLTLFGDIFDKIRSDYVEAPDEQKLIEAAINGMLGSLDPHSTYLDQKSNQDMQQQTKGEFGGLGIEVTMEDGLVKVASPFDDSPAAKAGIQPGDMITHINDDAVLGLTLTQAVDKMRGPINSAVKLKLLRNKKDVIEVSVTRDTIRPPVIKARKEGDDVVYLRISSFNEQTYENLKRQVELLSSQIPADKLKGFVVDLRNNPGGLLDQAISVSDAFLERGEIVSTRGRNVEATQRFSARTGDITKGKPVVVLINGGSASASEIVAGALQDHKRATIMGTRSFGKGSVQSIFQLRGNNALKLTTQQYYTPSGRSIQAKGITPDILVLPEVPEEFKGKDETKGEASLRGHLKSKEGEEAGGSSAYVPPDPSKDKQINAALDFLRGVKRAEAPTVPPAAAAVMPAAPATPEAKKN